MQTAELIAERPSRRMVESKHAPNGIKTILFHVHDDGMLHERLDGALSVARAYGAHLHLLHVTPIEAYTVVDAFATYVNAEVVGILESEAAKLRVRLEQQLAAEDVSWDYEEVTGSLMPHLVQRAALADLVLTGRERFEREFGGPSVTLLGDMLHSIRTPMLVLGDGTAQIDLFGPALIAWNGSYEAANALRFAVPLLKIASAVRIVSVKEPTNEQFPSTDALEYLSRHGIHAELTIVAPGGVGVDEQLLNEAASDGAAYLVMGGYSHSRAGEFLFGGVTRSLLQGSPLPLLVAR